MSYNKNKKGMPFDSVQKCESHQDDFKKIINNPLFIGNKTVIVL